jgi:DNA-directed RNA polymerase subunit RPC12/RpoP
MVETKPNAAVTCSQCGAEIRFFKDPKIPEEFSLACPSCARRKIYVRLDIHIPKESDRASQR